MGTRDATLSVVTGAPRKKLIEVALPLEAINQGCIREKNIRQSNPATLHLWWARRPLAACRAVLFASIVDDPSSRPDEFPTEEAQEAERHRLFKIIEDLVTWENASDERVIEAARAEIRRSTGGKPPAVLDPFSGGGSIPLEAQRLGLEAHGSDLNPVAVLLSKSLVEIPLRFRARPPVNPEAREGLAHSAGWAGAQGIAEDVRHYGKWMRDEAERRIGRLYPKARLPKSHGGGEATIIAWLWARTVKCPNPACGATMPLVRSFLVSQKKGRETWIEPVIVKEDRKKKSVRFEIRSGKGEPPEGTVNRRGARCLVCGETAPLDHVRAEGKAGRLSAEMMAVAAEGKSGRIYLVPDEKHLKAASSAEPTWKPDCELPRKHRNFQPPIYGMGNVGDLFTPRQLVALTTLSDLVGEVREKIALDAKAAGVADEEKRLQEGGSGAEAYADAVATYLAFVIDNLADLNNSLCRWKLDRECPVQLFARQAIPMVWDFPEANPLSESSGSWESSLKNMVLRLERLYVSPVAPAASIRQLDATAALDDVKSPIVSTDPPYYDNICYADLSDFFYVWLRRSLGKVWPDVTSTVLAPKTQELVATPHRFDGDADRAKAFFEEGLGRAFARMREAHNADYPLTVFYAFKQAEEDEGDDGEDAGTAAAAASTGWETMLEGLLKAGFAVTGTWPMRTEMAARSVSQGANALASSIVLVCRPRAVGAAMATRREFIAALKRELPAAIRALERENIAAVDLAQAAIGPGMAIFSRYAKVLEADGLAMTVRTALQIINEELGAYLAAQEGEMDLDTRFCLAWFQDHGMDAGPFGAADVHARAKNTSVQGLEKAGVLVSKGGKVRLLARSEYPDGWDPLQDRRLTIWETTQQLIKRLLDPRGGVEAAARLVARLGAGRSEEARALAHRLYSICDRKKRANEALAYNALTVEWPHIQRSAAEIPAATQTALDFGVPLPDATGVKPKPAKGRKKRATA